MVTLELKPLVKSNKAALITAIVLMAPGWVDAQEMRAIDEENIVASVQVWWSAWEEKDSGTLENMALPNYVEFTGHSDEPRVGRTLLMEVAARAFDNFTITDWEIIDPVVTRYGDVAVVAYQWTHKVMLEGQSTFMRGVATDVLIMKDFEWRYLSHHSTTLETGLQD